MASRLPDPQNLLHWQGDQLTRAGINPFAVPAVKRNYSYPTCPSLTIGLGLTVLSASGSP